MRILAACATVALWVGVSVAAQRMLERADPLPALAVAGAAGVLHAVIARLSLMAEGRGRGRIAAGLRRRVARLVDGVSREGRDIDPATASGAVVDWCANVADYLSKAVPLRPAAAGEMVVTWLAVTIVYWPAGILLLLAMVVVVANLRLSGILARDGSDEAMGLLQRLGAQILDTFSGVDVLVRFDAVGPFADRIRRSSKRHTAALMKVLRRAFISNLVMSATVTLSMAVIATFVGFALLGYVGVPGAPLDLGRGMLALTLCPVFFSPLESMASIFHTRQDADAGTRSLIRLGVGLDGEPDALSDVSDPVHGPVRVLARSLVMIDAQGHAVVGADAEIARPGEWTAIVGPSGSGKTTLLRAFSGLRTPGSGSVEWMTVLDGDGAGGRDDAGDDGKDGDVDASDGSADGIGTGTAAEATRIVPRPGAATWIGQSTLIVDASLRDNLRLGAPDATDERLMAALHDVDLDGTVGRLVDGLDTLCGSTGWRFSTGELRRIAIARALLRGSSVWLLDEPTEHLDPDTEQEVLDALKRACTGRTVIVATHSPAVVDRADVVFAIGSDHVLRRCGRSADRESPHREPLHHEAPSAKEIDPS